MNAFHDHLKKSLGTDRIGDFNGPQGNETRVT